MPKVSDEHKAQVRRRLLDAALVCLERNGYREVTTREVVSEAGVSTGTFYNYFPSKDDLYAALAQDALGAGVAGTLARVPAGAASGTGPALLGFLRDTLLADAGWAVAVSTFRARMGRPSPTVDEPAGAVEPPGDRSQLNRSVLQAFAPLVADAVDQGFLRADLDPEALVELLDLLWDGMGRRAADGVFQSSYGRVARVLVQVLLDGAVSPARRSEVPNA
jgi:AcrR family transcriptional regulator